MLQIVYISSARRPIGSDQLEEILDISRRNNQLHQVTGLLLAAGRRFLQALEGPSDAVLATYARIAADPRHGALVQLGCRTVETRQFGDWSMAFRGGGEIGGAADLRGEVERLVAPLDDANLRAQFAGFAELHARAA
ncbi:MAG: hypothetical protein JWO25_3546 [Alphaproteobacteria bacterium]|nr:hypothetical protein [Alphaproteobacteria bacterium]MDB5720164.1 hypothetical protein [Alphaproteobacteria bacterium]